MLCSGASAVARRGQHRDIRLCVKCGSIVVLLFLLVGGLEGLSRLYWWQIKGITHTDAESIFRTTYVELASSGIDVVAPYHGDASFDVLLLGPSVLHSAFGNFAPFLRERLQQKLQRPVRIINLSYPGRTSVESLMAYERMPNRRFDLVVFYHGVNDTHLNNCPPGEFRADYTHVRHIAMTKALERHPEVRWFALPYTMHALAINLGDRCRLTRGPWTLENGADLRTPPVFEATVERVVALAERRGDRLLLGTFAYYVPVDYTLEAFQSHRLDYALHFMPVETWASPTCFRRALDAHNEAVRRVAARHGTPLLDLARLMPQGRAYFHDPCHLTEAGCRNLAELVADAVR
jgi:hypothetical protein